MFDPDTAIIQAKVTLEDIAPPIWRQLLLPPTLNLAELHHVIQAAFGWLDDHLHQFVVGGLRYGAPELLEQDFEDDSRVFEATLIRLRDFEWSYTQPIRFLYLYDFGDDWRHLVELETRIPPDPALKYPACIDGARARPPENVGGVSGYAEFLEAWRDPDHEDHRHMRQWAGRSFDPERFDLAATDKAVRSAVRKVRKDYIFRRDSRPKPAIVIVACRSCRLSLHIVAYVAEISGLPPAPAGELTCALSGNGVLSTFVQEQPFYTAFHVARLLPKFTLSTPQLLYFCMCIKANRYRYSYGRQANRTVRDLVVPHPRQAPGWVDDTFAYVFRTWQGLLGRALAENHGR